MSKTEAVQKEMIAAMKAKDKEKKESLTLLLSALKAKAKDKREELTEEEENTIILKEIKQTKETMESAPDDRTDIIEQCKNRIAVYEVFAPQFMGEDEINVVIDEVLNELGLSAPFEPMAKGKIMKQLMPKVKGKADGGLVNQLVMKRLS
ncbi:MAG: GatB/YqeY domain-containing protein [Firmicutes bacterium]|nr:GatB/YqeY domain-containing protein [Bacillota bacterium]